MGDPVTILVVASTAVTAYSQVRAGQAASAAAKMEQAQLQSQQAQAQAKALDDEVNRRRELAMILGEQEALGGQSGLGTFMSGSSFLALREDSEQQARKDVEMIRLLGMNQTAQLSQEIFASKLRAREAKKQGYIKATGTILGGYVDTQRLSSGVRPDGGAPVEDRSTQAVIR